LKGVGKRNECSRWEFLRIRSATMNEGANGV